MGEIEDKVHLCPAEADIGAELSKMTKYHLNVVLSFTYKIIGVNLSGQKSNL